MPDTRGRQKAPQHPVLRWMLGVALRERREQAELSRDEVAEKQVWSSSKVYRIEEKTTAIDPRDVDELCTLYKVPAADTKSLVQLARDAKDGGGGWWTEYSDVIAGRYPALESGASQIDTYEPELVSGLVQVPAYAEAVIRAMRPTATDAEIKRRVEARMARQAVLYGSEPPTLRVILSEAALRRCAESNRELAREQFGALLTASERPNISIRMLPFSAGFGACVEGFARLGFRLSADLRIVYVGGLRGGNYVESHDGLKAYEDAWAMLSDSALFESKTADFMREELKGLK